MSENFPQMGENAAAARVYEEPTHAKSFWVISSLVEMVGRAVATIVYSEQRCHVTVGSERGERRSTMSRAARKTARQSAAMMVTVSLVERCSSGGGADGSAPPPS
jgi:hypothetical protein